MSGPNAGGTRDATGTASDPAVQPEPKPDLPVTCRACGHALTRRQHAIEVEGRHEHTFRNPAGYSFHVLCYQEADGAMRVGPATAEASWFAGHDWCFAICGECKGHVGWWYLPRLPAARGFVGLIATRVVRG